MKKVVFLCLISIASLFAQECKDELARKAIAKLIDKVEVLNLEVALLKNNKPGPLQSMHLEDYKVVVYYANIRECPSMSCDVVRVAKKDEKLKVLKVLSNGWIMLEDNTYIYSKLIK